MTIFYFQGLTRNSRRWQWAEKRGNEKAGGCRRRSGERKTKEEGRRRVGQFSSTARKIRDQKQALLFFSGAKQIFLVLETQKKLLPESFRFVLQVCSKLFCPFFFFMSLLLLLPKKRGKWGLKKTREVVITGPAFYPFPSSSCYNSPVLTKSGRAEI